ncbi:hypothetical protein ACV3J7_07305 [Salmonella enterica]
MNPVIKMWFGLHVPALALSFSVPFLAMILIPLFFAGDALLLLTALLKTA